jgi:WD40 repeat protein
MDDASSNLKPGKKEYLAFISYKHGRSGAFAERLEYALKLYAKPVFQRPPRIFRDEKHLVPGASLPALIRNALRSSEHLILLASPAAAASTWVADEIDTWCGELDGKDHLTIVLTEGTIAFHEATKKIDWTKTDALPPNLAKHLEQVPFYVDLHAVTTRESLDLANTSFRTEINRISAKLRGIDPNELLGVEVREHRRARRLRNGAIAALTVAFLAALGGAGWAWRERGRARAAEAEARRNQRLAEDQSFRARTVSAESDFKQATKVLESEKQGIPDLAMAHLTRALRTLPEHYAAAQRLVSVLSRRAIPRYAMRHDKGVSAIAFSPDGKLLATASGDKKARLWSTATGQLLLPPLAHDQAVNAVAFSPDGKRLATGAGDFVRIWDPVSGSLLADPPARIETYGDVLALVFSPDGKRLAASATGYTAHILDAETGRRLTPPLEHEMDVHGMAFSPDGSRLATASWDERLRIWDAISGRLVGKPIRHKGFVNAVAYSPDGKCIATASIDNQAHLWSAATSRALTRPLRHKGSVDAVVFSLDGRFLATASDDRTARIWHADTGRPVTEPLVHAGGVFAIAFSPDGKRLVTGSDDATARVWDTVSGRQIAELPHGSVVYNVAFSPDGTQVATTSGEMAQIWEPAMSHEAAPPLEHEGKVRLVVFSPDGKRLATGSDDHTARIWDALTGRPLMAPLAHKSELSAVAFCNGVSRVATASFDDTVRLWGEAPDKPLKTYVEPEMMSAVAFSTDCRFFATGSYGTGTARTWDFATGEPISPPIKHKRPIVALAFSPDGRRLVVSSDDNTVQILDATNGKLLGEALGHTLRARVVVFSPDGKLMATAADDGTARIWDGTTGQPRCLPLEHGHMVAAVTFSRNGKLLATGSYDGTARIWDASTGQPLTPPIEHGDAVLAVAFSPDSRGLATGSQRSEARIWDVATGQPLSEPLPHGGAVRAVAFSADGNRLATASEDKTARLWEVAPVKITVQTAWLDGIEAWLGARLDNGGLLIESPQQPLPLSLSQGNDEWGRLARWLGTSGPSRTVTPFSDRTLGEWVANRLTENTKEVLEQAYDTLPGDPLVIAAQAALAASSQGGDRESAALHAGYATKHARVHAEAEEGKATRPRQAAVHFHAARAWQGLGRVAEARAALATAMKLDPGRSDHQSLAHEIGLPGAGEKTAAADWSTATPAPTAPRP